MRQMYRPLVGFVALAAVVTMTRGGVGAVPGPPQAPVTVTTLAGLAPLSPLVFASGIAAAPNGDLYIYEGDYGVIRKLTPEGDLSVVVGKVGVPGSVDGVGTAARLTHGGQLVRTADGTLYFAESRSHTIRKVSPAGEVTTIGGLADQPGSADGARAAARFYGPRGVAVDSTGVVYVANTVGGTIRRIDLDGSVTTLAGLAGTSGSTDGTGSAARFYYPGNLTFTDSGDLMVTELINGLIRRVTPAGVVTRVAGAPQAQGYTDGTGSAAQFYGPQAIVNVGGGVFWVADRGNCAVRVVTEAGVVTHHPATPSGSRCNASTALYLDSLVATGAGTAAAVGGTGASGLFVLTTGSTVTTRYSAAVQPGATPGTGSAARLDPVVGMAGRDGLYYLFADFRSQTVTAGGVVSTLPSTYRLRGGAATAAGNYYILDCAIAMPNGTFAGAFGSSYPPDTTGGCASADGTGTAARFNYPEGVAADSSGNAYVADTGNHTIRKIAAGNIVTTIAGTAGVAGSVDGSGAAARFNRPIGIAVDSTGVVYVADSENHTIRRIATDGTVTTQAGLGGVSGGADAIGSAARFDTPMGLVIDGADVLYVADMRNHTVRQVTTAGQVTTLAGLAGVSGSADGAGSVARFRDPRGLAIDSSGALYVADSRNYTVRVLTRGDVTVPQMSTQPSNQRAGPGMAVVFQAAATGSPVPGYQWQLSANQGATWVNVINNSSFSGAQSAALTVNAIAAWHGYRFRAVAANVAGSVESASASLTVNTVTPNRNILRFGALKAGAAGELQSTTPAQSVSLSFFSDVVPNWTATSSSPWLQITNGSGAGAGSFDVSIVNPANVIGGATTLSGLVEVFASNALVTTTVVVEVKVTQSGSSIAPIGNFDTPVNGATNLSGAIVVSGWALDDVGVEKVEIWRDLVAGETTPPYVGPGPGNGKVFIAHGLFGSGTRPDVEQSFRHLYPLAYRGGWGYMLLTYGLPDRGNGTYVLRAFAYDTEGQYTSLGAKTISVNNNAATKPFGTLDYPEQSGAVSGTYTANGWVLTPNVNGVPTCTFDHIVMELDSNQVYIPVTYGQSRPDVTAAFPGLSTSSAPGASAVFDSTTFTNGVHTIGWLAYDTCGRGEGIGSRFITINNTGGGDTAVRPTRDLRSAGLDAPVLPRQTVRVDVLERAELTLPAIDGATWSGREVVGGEARQLPIGSSLDPVTGRFAWRPVAGFFGSFDLRFVAHVGGAAVAQVPVRVIVGPGVRLAIDMPTSHEQVPGVFTIAGWVADLAAPDGTGIDAVHVWAYPLEGGGDPIFAGHAGLGAPRPDVAAVHGAQFEASGYYLTVGHLPRGWYDIVVYPHSSVDGEFRGARVVRVLVR